MPHPSIVASRLISDNPNKTAHEQAVLIMAHYGLAPTDRIPVRLREAVMEPARRAWFARRAARRRARRQQSTAGRANARQPYRRVIHTIVGPEREEHFHATKGRRTYRRLQ